MTSKIMNVCNYVGSLVCSCVTAELLLSKHIGREPFCLDSKVEVMGHSYQFNHYIMTIQNHLSSFA